MAKEDSTLRALQIIQSNRIDMASQFGLFMWPDNPNWRKPGKCGHGTSYGIGMNLASGAYLGKLKKRGLIRFSPHDNAYRLTDAGKALLSAAG